MTTFFFGLVHGVGFAGALQEVGLPPARLFVSLITFNVGVEIGQIVIVLLVLPFLLKAKKYIWYPRFVQLFSALIFLMGSFWAFTRFYN